MYQLLTLFENIDLFFNICHYVSMFLCRGFYRLWYLYRCAPHICNLGGETHLLLVHKTPEELEYKMPFLTYTIRVVRPIFA